MLKNILDLIYPRKCIFCNNILSIDNKNKYVCEVCAKKLPFIPERFISINNKNFDNKIQNINFYFKNCISSFYYESVISKAICDFKFNNKNSYFKPLAGYISENIKKYYNNINFDFITYVPMFKSKERQRSYNQAALLAKHLSKTLKIPYACLVKKIKDNKPQHSLTLEKRKTNIKDVYKFSDNKNIKNKTILIIDDIITSGFTLNETAKVLKLSGAKDIYCATIATTKIKNKNSLLTYINNHEIN